MDLAERVTATGLLQPARRVLVLLSGGRDSVCLLDLAVRIAGPGRVAALHCNFGWRAAADADERHCAELCERLGAELHVRRPRRPSPPQKPGGEPAPPDGPDPDPPSPPPGPGNLQAWARDARYGAAVELVLTRGGDIAAGHTASDQVETVLYRLAASPGRRALLGMAARDGRLVRPLLGVSRDETAAHCTARGLAWREDASNDTPDFARNRVRNELLPALRSLHPAAEANVLRTLALLRDEAALLDAIVDDALARAGDPPALAALRALAPALRRLALQRLADAAAGSPGPAIGHRAEELIALSEGAALDVGRGLRAEVRHGGLLFGHSDGPAAPRRDRARP